ncbi:MAG: hypothetical protein WBV74_03000 [Pseudonocardiaceae bacterium]
MPVLRRLVPVEILAQAAAVHGVSESRLRYEAIVGHGVVEEPIQLLINNKMRS